MEPYPGGIKEKIIKGSRHPAISLLHFRGKLADAAPH
jgi:hypothetical protein